ncbi:MAG: hypothetical protein AAF419_03310, partial [Pseudomonadota bacterium]
MSLINKLLKDLEKRQAHLYQDQDKVLDGLSSAYDLHENKKSNLPFLLFLFFFSSLLVVFIIFYQTDVPQQISSIAYTNDIDYVDKN